MVVGINQYPAISNLQHACQDAADFHDWLVNGAGVPGANVKLVTANLAPGTQREDACPVAKQVWGGPCTRR